MPLELDTRQRAMLQEMGVHVWLPLADEPVVDEVLDQGIKNAIKNIANKKINTPATAENLVKNTVLASSVPPAAPRAANVVAKTQSALASPVEIAPLPAGLDSMDWANLQIAAASCQACYLGSGRKQVVFGGLSAASQADWLVVGDPPIETDEAQGQPFTGDAAQLLGNMLKAMGLTVNQVTLTSAVKCRTEGQSTGAHELAQCEAYLRRQVALSRPKMILAMGRYAAQALLAQTVSNPVPALGQLRGVVHSYQGVPVVVTYSPATLLRNPADKAKAWADLCLAKSTL